MFDLLRYKNWWRQKKARIYTFLLRGSIGKTGKGALIHPPFRSFSAKEVYIGNETVISEHCWIQCMDSYAGKTFSPRLEIGDNTHIGRFGHIIACSEMKIGSNVVIAERVYISDNLHGFEDIDMPIMPQELKNPGPVVIEDEVWIGNGACILPNVTLGRHSVIGSNAVVTKDVPPYSVVAGVPAKVIKQYDSREKKWVKA